MLTLVPIVEGDGEVDAVPVLIRSILHRLLQRFDVEVRRPKNAHGRGNLTRDGGIERFVKYALKGPAASGVLVLLDAEADVPCALACALRERIAALSPRIPTAVVCAQVQYESWFVDSIESLRGKCGIDPAAVWPNSPPPNPKTWLERHMPSIRAYKETTDQVSLTSALDFSLLDCRSRSFRRLCHAIEELVEACDQGTAPVTPMRCEEQ